VNNKKSFIGFIVIVFVIILQSTILSNFSIKGIKPDIVLVLLILISNYSGSLKGQSIGFTAGLVEDFVSLSPLGFNALIHTIIGYLSGITFGKIFLDPIFVPIVFVFIGTLIKSVLSFFLLLLFFTEKAGSIFTMSLFIEMGFNILITPVIYFFLKFIRILPSSNDSRLS